MTAILHPRSITIESTRCLLFGMLSLLAKSSYYPVKTTHQLHCERGAQAKSQRTPPPLTEVYIPILEDLHPAPSALQAKLPLWPTSKDRAPGKKN
jgi:hypothetical protein